LTSARSTIEDLKAFTNWKIRALALAGSLIENLRSSADK
jgi:hypothetical protein